MNIEAIRIIMNCIDNDLNNTYEKILDGQPYKQYMKELLDASYELMKYANSIVSNYYDIEYAEEHDRREYVELYK